MSSIMFSNENSESKTVQPLYDLLPPHFADGPVYRGTRGRHTAVDDWDLANTNASASG